MGRKPTTPKCDMTTLTQFHNSLVIGIRNTGLFHIVIEMLLMFRLFDLSHYITNEIIRLSTCNSDFLPIRFCLHCN